MRSNERSVSRSRLTRSTIRKGIGDLTIKDVTGEIDLEVTVQGAGRDLYGNERVALEARGEINRKDFGLTWNQVLETGGLLVGDAVKLAVDISAVKAAAVQAA